MSSQRKQPDGTWLVKLDDGREYVVDSTRKAERILKQYKQSKYPACLPLELSCMSHDDIGKRLGISRSMVQILERQALAKIGKALLTDPEFLFWWER
jgi:DNA-directed RNA polymerase specialized sigma24 family protein